MVKRKPGRPSSITFEVDKEKLRLADSNIQQLFKSKVRKFKSSSGAYIPLSQDYTGHDAFIIILNK
jgi:putative transposon-encoded protein